MVCTSGNWQVTCTCSSCLKSNINVRGLFWTWVSNDYKAVPYLYFTPQHALNQSHGRSVHNLVLICGSKKTNCVHSSIFIVSDASFPVKTSQREWPWQKSLQFSVSKHSLLVSSFPTPLSFHSSLMPKIWKKFSITLLKE